MTKTKAPASWSGPAATKLTPCYPEAKMLRPICHPCQRSKARLPRWWESCPHGTDLYVRSGGRCPTGPKSPWGEE
jgi:hypothetical protein